MQTEWPTSVSGCSVPIPCGRLFCRRWWELERRRRLYRLLEGVSAEGEAGAAGLLFLPTRRTRGGGRGGMA